MTPESRVLLRLTPLDQEPRLDAFEVTDQAIRRIPEKDSAEIMAQAPSIVVPLLTTLKDVLDNPTGFAWAALGAQSMQTLVTSCAVQNIAPESFVPASGYSTRVGEVDVQILRGAYLSTPEVETVLFVLALPGDSGEGHHHLVAPADPSPHLELQLSLIEARLL